VTLVARYVPPPLVFVGAAAAGVAVGRTPREVRVRAVVRLRTRASMFARFALDLCMCIAELQAELATLVAAPPCSVDELLDADVPRGAILGRLCASEMARSPMSHWSAAELAERLRPRLDGGCSPQAVRHALRSSAFFVEVYRGRFQLGFALATEQASES
jgi:hypothetical protein